MEKPGGGTLVPALDGAGGGDGDCLLARLARYGAAVRSAPAAPPDSLGERCVVTSTTSRPSHVRVVEMLCQQCSLLAQVSKPGMWRHPSLIVVDPEHGEQALSGDTRCA